MSSSRPTLSEPNPGPSPNIRPAKNGLSVEPKHLIDLDTRPKPHYKGTIHRDIKKSSKPVDHRPPKPFGGTIHKEVGKGPKPVDPRPPKPFVPAPEYQPKNAYDTFQKRRLVNTWRQRVKARQENSNKAVTFEDQKETRERITGESLGAMKRMMALFGPDGISYLEERDDDTVNPALTDATDGEGQNGPNQLFFSDDASEIPFDEDPWQLTYS